MALTVLTKNAKALIVAKARDMADAVHDLFPQVMTVNQSVKAKLLDCFAWFATTERPDKPGRYYDVRAVNALLADRAKARNLPPLKLSGQFIDYYRAAQRLAVAKAAELMDAPEAKDLAEVLSTPTATREQVNVAEKALRGRLESEEVIPKRGGKGSGKPPTNQELALRAVRSLIERLKVMEGLGKGKTRLGFRFNARAVMVQILEAEGTVGQPFRILETIAAVTEVPPPAPPVTLTETTPTPPAAGSLPPDVQPETAAPETTGTPDRNLGLVPKPTARRASRRAAKAPAAPITS